jgi:unsaturated rhamnogalacturonyl hydrolase
MSICSFLMRYGRLSGSEEAINEAWAQVDVHVNHLVNASTNLARHVWLEVPDSYAQSTYWSRGNGWLVCALVDLIADDRGSEEAKHAASTLNRILSALLGFQDRSGFWRNVIDDPHERLEASGTLMHVYAIARGVQLGVVDAANMPAAIHGFEAVEAAVDDAGWVTGVAVPPGGPGVPLGVSPFGQGFYLRAWQALIDAGGWDPPRDYDSE